MNNFRRFAIASVALALGLPAVAQNAETANAAPTTTTRTAPVTPPSRTVPNSATSKAVLKPYSPFITQTGVGAGGADVSELYTTLTLPSGGYNIYGYGFQATAANSCADDFVAPAGWNIDTIKWLAYQTGAPSSGSITGIELELWNTDPNGQLPGGGVASSLTGFISAAGSGVYRVLDSDLGAISRAIIEVTADGNWTDGFVGTAGTYWLAGQATGSLASGPWTPPATVAGQTPPTGATYNGYQSVGGGAFAQVFDTGNPVGSINEPSEFNFQLEGTGGGGVGTFCTSRPSSLPNCTPSLSGPGSSVSKSGAPAYNVVASPVPGGGGKPGILIYTKNGLLGSPANTPFGELCLNQFLRAGAFASVPGGTSGVCDGSYSWDFAAIAAFYGQIVVNDVIHIQAWYRDPANPGTANFTQGIGPISVIP
jgi:hypothetical protein